MGWGTGLPGFFVQTAGFAARDLSHLTLIR
jgi:hypothetical protein